MNGLNDVSNLNSKVILTIGIYPTVSQCLNNSEYGPDKPEGPLAVSIPLFV